MGKAATLTGTTSDWMISGSDWRGERQLGKRETTIGERGDGDKNVVAVIGVATAGQESSPKAPVLFSVERKQGRR